MELRLERRDIGDVNPCIATTKSVTSQLASAAHTCRLPLSPIAHHARYQIGQPLEAFREAFAPRGEAYTEMHGHCKAVARRPGVRSTPPRAASSQKAREFSPEISHGNAVIPPTGRTQPKTSWNREKKPSSCARLGPRFGARGQESSRAAARLPPRALPLDVFDTVKYERASRQLDIRLRAPPTSPCAARPGRAPLKNRSPPWHEEAALRRPSSVHNKSGDNLIHDELDAATGEEVMQ